jgi:hypothetical protein
MSTCYVPELVERASRWMMVHAPRLLCMCHGVTYCSDMTGVTGTTMLMCYVFGLRGITFCSGLIGILMLRTPSCKCSQSLG